MCAVMFDRRNILPSFSNELIKVVDFLNEKAAVGEFEFSDSVFYWKIMRPLSNRWDWDIMAVDIILLRLSHILQI